MSFFPMSMIFIVLAFVGILSIAAMIVILVIIVRRLMKKHD